MKTGIKALYLTLTLLGVGGCSPAHAATAKTDAGQPQIQTAPANPAKISTDTALKTTDKTLSDAGDGIVSINTGTAEELARSMNGVGLKKAQSIVSYRDQYGPFRELEQLEEVPGIGSALVERNRTRIKL